jgi:hypothetical protein
MPVVIGVYFMLGVSGRLSALTSCDSISNLAIVKFVPARTENIDVYVSQKETKRLKVLGPKESVEFICGWA